MITYSLYRIDKITQIVTEYNQGERAVDQFMIDFNIKTRNTARVNLFALLTDESIHYWQNTQVAWSTESF